MFIIVHQIWWITLRKHLSCQEKHWDNTNWYNCFIFKYLFYRDVFLDHFACFLIWLFAFLLLSFKCSFYNLSISFWNQIGILQIFSLSLWLTFLFSNQYLLHNRNFSLNEVQITTIFLNWIVLLIFYLKTYYQTQGNRFFPKFLLEVL